MVYCDYVSNTDSTVTYKYGASVDDITGTVVFHFLEGNEGIETVEEPKKGEPWDVHMMRLYGKERRNFQRGIFGKKISYEIG
uniref:Uncharacterized protein n=1 Tax=Siphoviridae sp. ct0d96 TaxID=2826268 RepID=A0A8S5M4Q3_9CAUD|nr:MAG TPA: hypothetical protein [Siphoviridae sp. ct0d96]